MLTHVSFLLGHFLLKSLEVSYGRSVRLQYNIKFKPLVLTSKDVLFVLSLSGPFKGRILGPHWKGNPRVI